MLDRRYCIPAALFVVIFVLAACSSGTDSGQATPSTATFRLRLDGLSQSAVAGEDTLRIDSVQVVMEQLSLGDRMFPVNIIPGRVSARVDPEYMGEALLLGSREVPTGTYFNSSFSLALPEDLAAFDSGSSVWVSGTFNGSRFVFRTDTLFTRDFNFSNSIDVPAQNLSLTLTISATPADWFRVGQSLLNPALKEDRQHIEQNIKPSFDLEITSTLQ